MSTIAQELDEQLRQMDPETAKRVEREVRETLRWAKLASGPKDAMGYPIGFFEATEGALAGEEFERPPQLPLEKRPEW